MGRVQLEGTKDTQRVPWKESAITDPMDAPQETIETNQLRARHHTPSAISKTSTTPMRYLLYTDESVTLNVNWCPSQRVSAWVDGDTIISLQLIPATNSLYMAPAKLYIYPPVIKVFYSRASNRFTPIGVKQFVAYQLSELDARNPVCQNHGLDVEPKQGQ